MLISNLSMRDGKPARGSSFATIPICNYAFQQIGKAYKQFALAHPDSVLDAGEREEINLQLRDRIAGTKFPVALLEDVKKAVSHVEVRLARAKS